VRPRRLRQATAVGILLMSAWLWGRDAGAQQAPRTHQLFMTAVELNGATTIDTLAPPAVNPGELSKGYGFKGPGKAEKTAPRRREVASDTFAPGFITVPQGGHRDAHRLRRAWGPA
jgi:hypothetical protein